MDNFELLNDLVARKRKVIMSLPQGSAVLQACMDCYECGARDMLNELENREIERKSNAGSSVVQG